MQRVRRHSGLSAGRVCVRKGDWCGWPPRETGVEARCTWVAAVGTSPPPPPTLAGDLAAAPLDLAAAAADRAGGVVDGLHRSAGARS